MVAGSDNAPAFEAVLEAQEARHLLDFVADITGNGETLRELLAMSGFRIGRDRFRNLIGRLERDGLIRSHVVDGMGQSALVLRLTSEGADVQQGATRRDWIATPSMRD